VARLQLWPFTAEEIVPDTHWRYICMDSDLIWRRCWIRQYTLPQRIEPRLPVGSSCNTASLLAALSGLSLSVLRNSMVWLTRHLVARILSFGVGRDLPKKRRQTEVLFQIPDASNTDISVKLFEYPAA
jgi:hypothetical protein